MWTVGSFPVWIHINSAVTVKFKYVSHQLELVTTILSQLVKTARGSSTNTIQTSTFPTVIF